MATIVGRRGPHVSGHENATLQVRVLLRLLPHHAVLSTSICSQQLPILGFILLSLLPVLTTTDFSINVSTWQWCFAYRWSWVSGFGCWILGRCSSESCDLEWTSSISYDVCCRTSTFWGLVFLDSASSCHGCLCHWQPTVSRGSYVQLV